jgi:hypothetical protein
MRLVTLGLASCIAVAGTASAQSPQRLDVSGSWAFTWDNNAANTNVADLTQGAGTFTGTYVNDNKEKCPLAGRMSSPTAVSLTIVCPRWEIKADGSITDERTVAGSYTAYGTSKGTFRMSRK